MIFSFYVIEMIKAGAEKCDGGGTEGTVYEALEKGFDDLADLCDVVEEKFIAAKEGFMEVSA